MGASLHRYATAGWLW